MSRFNSKTLVSRRLWASVGLLLVAGVVAWDWIAAYLPTLRVVLVVGLVAVVAGMAVRSLPKGPARMIAARERRANRTGGWATPLDIMRSCGWWWLRRQVVRVRPSLAARSWWYRWLRLPFNEVGVRVARVRFWFGMLWIYASHERITIRFAGPQVGKTAEMNNHLIDAPGPVVSTSIRADAMRDTAPLRKKIGPVWAFDPDGLGGDEFGSTFKWNPLVGCEDPRMANRRALHFISGIRSSVSIGDKEFWNQGAVSTLDMFLHAAALGKCSIKDVLRWVGDSSHGEAFEIQGYLSRSVMPEVYLSEYQRWMGLNHDTATSVTFTLTMSLQWLRLPGAAALIAKPGEDTFDLDEFLSDRGTVYLLAEEDSSVGPLFTAFVGFVYEESRKRAGSNERPRLDPPLTMCLDEAANICSVPLDRWTSTMSGSGFALHLAFQNVDQVISKWGEHAAASIMENAGLKLWFGGSDNIEHLENMSRLFGEVTVHEWKEIKEDGRTIHRREQVKKRVVTPDRISKLQPGEVVVMARNLQGATVGRILPFYKRADYRAVKKARLQDARELQRALGEGPWWRRLRLTGSKPLWQRLAITHRPHQDSGSVPVPEPRVEADGVEAFDAAGIVTKEDGDE